MTAKNMNQARWWDILVDGRPVLTVWASNILEAMEAAADADMPDGQRLAVQRIYAA